MFKQFVALSGHARSGSTLLSSVLSQNPEIYAGGSSAVCQLMWDMHQSINNSEEIKANNLTHLDDMVKNIPHLYYANTDRPIIIDRHRSWTLPSNIDLLKKYIDKNIKIIVLTRPTIEVVKSIVYLRIQNGWENPEANLFVPESEPIIRPIAGVNWAKQNYFNEFLFVEYNEFVKNPKQTIDSIYKYCNWQPYEHNFTNIVNSSNEDDSQYGLLGLHDIRQSVKSRALDIELSDDTIDMCYYLDSLSEFS